MDNLQIQLDGSEIVRGVNDAVTALHRLQAAIAEFAAASPKGQIQAQMAAVSTSAVDAVQSTAKALSGISTELTKGIQKAQEAAKAGGKSVSKALGDGLKEDGDKVTSIVRQQVRELQNEYEKLVIAGKKLSSLELQSYRARGVSLTPDDRINLQAFQESLKASSNVLAMRTKLARDEASLESDRARLVANAGAGLALLQRKLAEQRLAQEQADANRTFQLRQSWVRREDQERARALAQEQADANRTLRFRNNFAKQEEEQILQRQQLVARAAKGLAKLQQAMADSHETLRWKSATGVDPRTLLGLPPDVTNRSAKASASVFSDFFKNEDSAALKASTTAKKVLRDETKALHEEQRKLAERSREVHSALRGVAGAGGALFLTYGSLIPLAGAFFVTSAIRDAVKDFKDLEYQLKFVQAIAGDTTVTLKDMMSSVAESAKAVGVMPVEAAQGLRILAQAGLSSQEALNALPDVLRLAAVGELGMAQAAETATGAVNAFGLGVDNIGKVTDVFFKAAAISNTSVAKISESMKQASTVAERYKISIEDAGTALVALAKRNITGSSAGTALTQMFEELATPRGEAKKLSKTLGISIFDPLKKDFKQFLEEFLPQLRTKLAEFDVESQTFIMNRLTNNRGAKALSAIMGLSDDELAKIKESLGAATGAAARATIGVNDSLEGDLRKLKAAYSELLALGGEGGDSNLRAALQSLKDLVENKSTHAFLSDLVGAVSGLLRVVTFVAEKWVEWDAFRAKLPLWMDPLGGISRLIRDIQGLMTDGAQAEKALSYIDNSINKEREYQKTLQDSIDKLREKLGLQKGAALGEIEQRLQEQETRVTGAQAKVDEEMAKGPLRVMGRSLGTQTPLLSTTAAQRAAQAELAREQGRLNQILDAKARFENERAVSSVLEATRRDLENQAAAKGKIAKPAGSRHLTDTTGAAAAANSALAEQRRALELAASARKQQFSSEEEDFRHREAMLKDSYERGALSYAAYQSQLQDIQGQASAMRRRAIEAEKAALEAAEPKLAAALNAARAAGAQTSLQRLPNDVEQFRQKVDALQLQIKQLDDKEIERASDALTKALQPSAEILRNVEKERAAQSLNVDQELEKLAVKRNGAQLSEKEAFVQEQILRITNAQADTLGRLKQALQDMLAPGGPLTAIGDDGFISPDAVANWRKLQEQISKASKGLDDTKARVGAAADVAFDNKKVDEFAKNLNSSLSDAIIDAGHDGGAGLRRVLEEELLRKPFKMVLQAALQPYTDEIARSVGATVNRGAPGAAPGAGIPGGLNIPGLDSIGGLGGLTQLAGIAAAGSAVASMLGKLMGLGERQMKAASVAGALVGGIPGALLAKLFVRKGGDKQDGAFGLLGSGIGEGSRSASNDDAAAAGAEALQKQYDAIAKAYNGKADLTFGLGFSMDPKGDAPTMLDITGSRNGNVAFTSFKGDVGRDEQALQAAIEEMSSRAILRGLQSSGLEGGISEYLKGLGDVDKLSGGALKRAIERVQKAAGEKEQLEERYFQMSSTAEQQLTRARENERKALDETNLALAERVYRLDDEFRAQEKAKAGIDRARDSARQAVEFIAGFKTGIRGYIDKLNATPQGLLPPGAQLTNARAQFDLQMSLARGGNRDALQGITGYADQLIAAQTSFSASGAPTSDTIAYIKRALSELPQMQSDADIIAGAVSEAAGKMIASIGGATEKTVATMKELQLSLTDGFGKVDTSVNGALDFAELKAYFGPLATDVTLRSLITSVDANGDGSLSKLELLNATIKDLQGSMSLGFDEIDTSMDSVLDFEELKSYFAGIASDDVLRQVISAVDADKNSAISKLELLQATINATSAREVAAIAASVTADNPLLVSAAADQAAPQVNWNGTGFESENAYRAYLDSKNYFADGGSHSGGWRIVGEEGPELEFTGPSRIYSHEQSMKMLQGAGSSRNDDALVERIAKLEGLLQTLITVTASGARGTINAVGEVVENTATSARSARLMDSRASV